MESLLICSVQLCIPTLRFDSITPFGPLIITLNGQVYSSIKLASHVVAKLLVRLQIMSIFIEKAFAELLMMA